MTSAQDSLIGRWLVKGVVEMASDRGADGLKRRAQRALIRLFVTRKLMKRFGGRVRLMVCGGAPLSNDLARILQTIGLPLLEGYGLAEAAGPVSGDFLADYVPGAVGRPLDGVDIKFAESGEILLRSGSVMSGYWKRPAETAKALDEDGWLHTGDVGELHDGRLHIHGRIRDLIVLSTGEKLAPSDIESQIITDALFEQALVLGDKKPIVVALVVLDNEGWIQFAAMHGLDPTDPNTAAGQEALRERIAAKCQAFPNYAEVRRLHASFEPWTVEDGLLSVTLKIKRDAVSTRYQAEIEGLFVGHE